MKAIVLTPEVGDIYVWDLSGKEEVIDAYGEYTVLGQCEKENRVVLRSSEHHIFSAQVSDFIYTEEEGDKW